jgi:Phage terminase large subunit
MTEKTLAYRPTVRQQVFHARAGEGVGEILYGGAAGGGKTYGLVQEGHTRCLLTPKRQVVLFRRTKPQLRESIIPLMRELAEEVGESVCVYRESTSEMKYTNGAVFGVRYAETEKDVRTHTGASWDTLLIDEAGDWRWEEVSYLLSRLRTTIPGITPQLLLSSNPLGIGFEWLKQRYVVPSRAQEIDAVWTPESTDDDPHPVGKCYIPATHEDNPLLNEGYAATLMRIKNPIERAALLLGSWDLPADETVLFQPGVIQAMQLNAVGAQRVKPGHKYLHVWDLARKRDWTVGITLDITTVPLQIVQFDRFRFVPWPQVAERMKTRHEAYKGATSTSKTLYDDTGLGDPVGQFLQIPLGELQGFQFTGPSKGKAVDALVLACEQARIKGPALSQKPGINGIESLWSELSVYRHDDKGLVQDTVMALALAAWDQRERVVATERERGPQPVRARRAWSPDAWMG